MLFSIVQAGPLAKEPDYVINLLEGRQQVTLHYTSYCAVIMHCQAIAKTIKQLSKLTITYAAASNGCMGEARL